MVSEILEARVVFKRRSAKKFDREGKALIDRVVRKLVLVMRGLEVSGQMSRADIEDCVISSLEQAEFMFYGLSDSELMGVMEREIKNDKMRKGNK